MWGCDCYSTFRRRVSALPLALRLALSPAWPRGMPPGRSADVTAMLCTSSPPPLTPHFYTSSVEPTCCSGKAHARLDAQIPLSGPLLHASALPSPARRVCTTAEALRANAGSPALGVEIKQTMTFPFPARLSQVKTHLKTTSVLSDPTPHPTPPWAVNLNVLFQIFAVNFI